MSFPGRLRLMLTIEENGKPSINMSDMHVVMVTELNDRLLTLEGEL